MENNFRTCCVYTNEAEENVIENLMKKRLYKWKFTYFAMKKRGFTKILRWIEFLWACTRETGQKDQNQEL